MSVSVSTVQSIVSQYAAGYLAGLNNEVQRFGNGSEDLFYSEGYDDARAQKSTLGTKIDSETGKIFKPAFVRSDDAERCEILATLRTAVRLYQPDPTAQPSAIRSGIYGSIMRAAEPMIEDARHAPAVDAFLRALDRREKRDAEPVKE